MAPPSVAPRANVYSSTGIQQRANRNGNSARSGSPEDAPRRAFPDQAGGLCRRMRVRRALQLADIPVARSMTRIGQEEC